MLEKWANLRLPLKVWKPKNAPWPLTRGSVPGPRWGPCPQIPVIGSRYRARHGVVPPEIAGRTANGHRCAEHSWHLGAWPHIWSCWMASATYAYKTLLNNFSIFVAIGFPEHFGVICKFQYHTEWGRIQITNKYQKQNWIQNRPLWYSATNRSPRRFTAAHADFLLPATEPFFHPCPNFTSDSMAGQFM